MGCCAAGAGSMSILSAPAVARVRADVDWSAAPSADEDDASGDGLSESRTEGAGMRRMVLQDMHV